ncbi:MAG TPA: hypothetical protein PLZ84_02490 [Clostridia bacterium]|nr:hypothetical protein [Clostridia bacterium]
MVKIIKVVKGMPKFKSVLLAAIIVLIFLIFSADAGQPALLYGSGATIIDIDSPQKMPVREFGHMYDP